MRLTSKSKRFEEAIFMDNFNVKVIVYQQVIRGFRGKTLLNHYDFG